MSIIFLDFSRSAADFYPRRTLVVLGDWRTFGGRLGWVLGLGLGLDGALFVIFAYIYELAFVFTSQ